jgi:hypothetical protein
LRAQVRVLAVQEFFLLHSAKTDSGAHPTFNEYRKFLPGVYGGRSVKLTTKLYLVQRTKRWSYTSTFPYVFTAQHRENHPAQGITWFVLLVRIVEVCQYYGEIGRLEFLVAVCSGASRKCMQCDEAWARSWNAGVFLPHRHVAWDFPQKVSNIFKPITHK